MTNNFFVMLMTRHDSYTPLMVGNIMAKFHTMQDAINAGKASELGAEFGFEVFELNCGSYCG